MRIPLVIWVHGMLADMPNCSQYPAACANYNAQQSGTIWVILAAAIILAAGLGVAAALMIRQRRRGHRQPPPPPPPWPGQF